MIALALLLLAAADPRDEAKESFERGLSAFDQERYREALELFERSLALRETATVWYNLALTHYRLGRYDAALGALERYSSLERPPDRSQQQQLDDMTRELKKRLTLLEITVRHPDTKITLDGREVSPGPIHVMPGLHTLAAQRPQHRPLTKSINAAAGDRLTIDMSPEEIERASIVVGATPEDAELAIDGTVEGEPIYATWWFWTIAGVVVAGAAVAIGVAAAQDRDVPTTKIYVEALHR